MVIANARHMLCTWIQLKHDWEDKQKCGILEGILLDKFI